MGKFILILFLTFFISGLTACGNGGSGGSSQSQSPQSHSNPTLASISPTSSYAGSSSITITCTGSNFYPSSVVQLDGSQLSTTYVSASSIQAQIPANALQKAGSHFISVYDPEASPGISQTQSFLIVTPSGTKVSTLNVQASDIVWDPKNKVIYAAVPSVATNNANSVIAINPVTGAIVQTQVLNAEDVPRVVESWQRRLG